MTGIYYVMTEYESDKIYFMGSYETCKEWINQHYSDVFGIVSNETGQFMSIVWS